MKRSRLVLTLVIAHIFLGCDRLAITGDQIINPLLGDISYVDKFGYCPNADTDEDLRIMTHLSYVENLLRQRDCSRLTPELQNNRKKLLDFLHEYWSAGIFPRNYDYANERRPCFIDKDGKICAVGYLIEQSAGRMAAEKINSDHQYDKILEMKDHAVLSWISKSGLTLKECAMIQPMYGTPGGNSTYINSADAVVSGGLIGINLGLTALNFANSTKGKTNQTVQNSSVFFGLAQVALGGYEIWRYPETSMYAGNGYASMKKLGMTNIAIGTGTTLIGIYYAFSNTVKKDKSITWNIYSFPIADKQLAFGFHLTKKI